MRKTKLIETQEKWLQGRIGQLEMRLAMSDLKIGQKPNKIDATDRTCVICTGPIMVRWEEPDFRIKGRKVRELKSIYCDCCGIKYEKLPPPDEDDSEESH